jgi:hypothetical protein
MVFTIKVNEKTHNLDESRKVTAIGPPLLGESSNELPHPRMGVPGRPRTEVDGIPGRPELA